MDFNDTILVSRTPRFLGIETDDWEGWISRFESLTQGYKDEERIKRLLPLLDGVASDCASSHYKTDRTYEGIKAHLSARFGRAVDPLQAQAELGRVTQRPGESAANFADRIRKLGQAAFPDMAAGVSEPAAGQADTKTTSAMSAKPGKMSADSKPDNVFVMKTLTSRFICGLSDEWLQTKLCHKRPESLTDAVSMIHELHKRQEVIQAVRVGHTAAAGQAGRGDLGSAAASARVQVEGGGDHRDALIAQLEREVGDLRASLEAATVANGGSGPDSSRRAVCYGCGSPGHFRRDCPAVRRGQPRHRATKVTCYSCGEEGHIRNNCPFSARAGASPRPICLLCGRSGHWMAACHALSDQWTRSIQGGQGEVPKPTTSRVAETEN